MDGVIEEEDEEDMLESSAYDSDSAVLRQNNDSESPTSQDVATGDAADVAGATRGASSGRRFQKAEFMHLGTAGNGAGPADGVHGAAAVHVQQMLRAGAKGTRNGSMNSGLLGGLGSKPTLPMVPEESLSKLSMGEGDSAASGLHDGVNLEAAGSEQPWW